MASGISARETSALQPSPIYTYRIIPSTNQTFGYQIFMQDKLMIEQPTIPGIPSGNGFVNAKQATLVAKKVIQKLKKGIFPPQISSEELQRWGITFKL
jgi:hypothetical protein